MRKVLSRISVIIMLTAFSLVTAACGSESGIAKETYESVLAENANFKREQDELKQKVKELTAENKEIQVNCNSYMEKLESLQKEYDEYKVSMKEYEELGEAEAEARRIEAQRIIDEHKAEEERKAAEEAERREQEEKAGYDTGITYSQLARNPDDYKDGKVKFKGKVLQIMEDSKHDYIQMRFAVDGNYDEVLYCEYQKDIVSQRILEDDIITIYGVSYGLYTYKTAIGSQKTIPGVIINKIDQ